jgi:NAD+ kinase
MTLPRIACIRSGSQKAKRSYAELADCYELLPHTASVTMENLDPGKRPLAATADFMEVFGVLSITIREDSTTRVSLLFDPDRSLQERVIAEQFAV